MKKLSILCVLAFAVSCAHNSKSACGESCKKCSEKTKCASCKDKGTQKCDNCEKSNKM